MPYKNRSKQREANRRWREANREKARAASATYLAANREKVNAATRARRAANPEKVRAAKLRDNYGLTHEIYEELLAAQGHCCAVKTCKATDPGNNLKHFCVDHCHNTGRVRGLLCHRCNIALPHGRDTEEFLAGLVEYVQRHQRQVEA